MKNQINKAETRQNNLIKKINKKLNKKEQKELKEIIDIEYRLTMIEEGHEPKTIFI